MTPPISVVIPTVGRPSLRLVLDRLAAQDPPGGGFEVVVAVDASTRAVELAEVALTDRPFAARSVQGGRPGASSARNAGLRAATAELVLFLDDDVLPEPRLVAEHLEWHRRNPEESVGVLGDVRWADELHVTPFMRWLEHGIQFDYPRISGTDAGWGRFYTANASVKRSLVERVGGFDEERLPFGYEDLDLALRMHEQHGFRLLYNRAARAEHLHAMDLDGWRTRVRRIAASERTFAELHEGFRPYFHELFASAAPPSRRERLAAALAPVVRPSTPVLGRRVWASVDRVYRRELAGPFLAAWRRAEP